MWKGSRDIRGRMWPSVLKRHCILERRNGTFLKFHGRIKDEHSEFSSSTRYLKTLISYLSVIFHFCNFSLVLLLWTVYAEWIGTVKIGKNWVDDTPVFLPWYSNTGDFAKSTSIFVSRCKAQLYAWNNFSFFNWSKIRIT